MAVTPSTRPELIEPLGHSNDLFDAAWSLDGQHILTGSADKTARIWDARGREILTLAGHEADVLAVAWAPDGSRVATASFDQTARIWDFRTGAELLCLRGHSANVSAVAWSADSRQLLTGSGDNSIRRWNAQTGECLQHITGHTGEVQAVRFAPHARFILSGAEDGLAVLWNTDTGQAALAYRGHTGGITALAVAPDGSMIATGSRDNTLRIWSAHNGEPVRTLTGHQSSVYGMDWSPDGRHLLSASHDGSARLWETATGQCVRSLQSDSYLSSTAFSPDGGRILTAGGDHTARIWNTDTFQLQHTLEGHTSYVLALAWSPDGRRLLTAGSDFLARIWDLSGSRPLQLLHGHSDHIQAVAWSPKGDRIATAGWDQTACIWDANTRELLLTYTGHTDIIWSIAWSPDGEKVATGSSDLTAQVWSAADGERLHLLQGHTKIINAVAWSPDGSQLLTGARDHSARLWSVQNGTRLLDLQGFTDGVWTAAFAPDGSRLATGCIDGTAQIWDPHTGACLHQLSGHENTIYSLAWSPDSQCLVTASRDRSLRLWSVTDGGLLRQLEGHTHDINAVTFSPDGVWLASGSLDTSIRLWNARTGQETATLYAVDTKDWVITSPAGLFDAAPPAMALMHYVVNHEGKWIVLELDQLKERYWEPGLLPRLLGLQSGMLRDVSRLDTVDLFPHLEARIERDQLRVDLAERNGGLGRLSLFINDKEVLADANPENAASVLIPQSLKAYLLPGTNALRLQVWNEAGWLRSEPWEAAYTYVPTKPQDRGTGIPLPGIDPTPSPQRPQHLYAIVIGTSRYGAPGIRSLTFPDKDATEIAAALRHAGEALFGAGEADQRVSVHLLTTREEANINLADKPHIKQAFADVAAQAQPQDVLFVYLSGHGATHGLATEAAFYYLTRDLYSDNLNDSGNRTQGAISSQELTEWITAIPAHKQLLVLDTCHAGKVVDQLSGSRDLNDASRVRALDRMKDRTGMFVLAGSPADAVSYEASIFGQGLLTYSLLLGMKGGALADGQFIDVNRLVHFAREKVPEFAAFLRLQQEPVISIPRGGESFYLGKVDEQVMALITIAQPKPVFVGSIFLEADSLTDPLGLSEEMDEQLRQLTSEGKDAPLIFVDVRELDIAYSLRGLYQKKDGRIQIDIRLLHGQQGVDRFAVQAPKTAELMQNIAGQAMEKVAALVQNFS